ncbi:hypothetical protein AAFF_G00086840 [Aldrovandia affinis]|uniref:PPM-type phosphatase domain-containing protein n=1 Tax=Aldrovandia affinis TaxID=143900 RepID=A0AAD7RWL9_9TELE|nr:hypothetical protein AAFF_G00086840 [Aldrovandia affinis]
MQTRHTRKNGTSAPSTGGDAKPQPREEASASLQSRSSPAGVDAIGRRAGGNRMGAEGAEARRFLDEFVTEFPEPLGHDDPLPLGPLSGTITAEEIRGECLDLALRLLAARNAPPLLSAALSHTALTELLKSDLTPHHLPPDPEQVATLLHSDSLQRCFFNNPARPVLSSAHAIRNARRKMEDRHVALADFNQLFGIQDEVHRGYFAVFDGHGGVDAATYAATHLHVTLGYDEHLGSDPAAALKRAFTCTDHMFHERAKRERLRSGSDAGP